MRSAIPERSERVELHIDQYNGEIVNRVDFSDFPPLAAGVSLGIAFHQGELYGLLNKLQNLFAAILGTVLAVSGFLAWWMRRPKGSLGVPPAPSDRPLNIGVVFAIVVLMVFLPLMAASLIAVLLLDRFVFKPLGLLQAPA